jgi:ribosomal protein L4
LPSGTQCVREPPRRKRGRKSPAAGKNRIARKEPAGPRTKEFQKLAGKLGLTHALLVTEEPKENLDLGIRNLPSFKSLPVAALNVLDILSYDQLVITLPAFEKISEVLGR